MQSQWLNDPRFKLPASQAPQNSRLARFGLLLCACLILATAPARAADEQALIATLQASSNPSDVWAACQQLRLRGTARSVPALAALLVREETSHAARHALEAMPCPEAGAALRQALGQTAGLVKVGIIHSLGWRGEAEAVLLLRPLLEDADTTVASAAAWALGRISGADALAALQTALGKAPPAVAPAVQEALIRCAEQLLERGDRAGAAALYSRLLSSNYPPAIRMAAWRGLVLAEPDRRPQRLSQGLVDTDPCVYLAALQVVREAADRSVLEACLARWSALTPEAAIAVLDAYRRLGRDVLPLAQQAGQSPHLSVRMAVWDALGDLGDPAAIPALAKAAAHSQSPERDAARRALARVRGPNARELLLAHLAKAEPAEQAELLRALGERGDRQAASVLLARAASDSELVRAAALEALQRLALPETLEPLLELAAQAKTEPHREAILKALYAVTQALTNKAEAGRSLVASLQRFPVSQRRGLLPLLAELATPEALAAAVTAARDPDMELAKAAVAVLGQWPNSTPIGPLLELARGGQDVAFRTLALRAAVEVAGQEPDLSRRLAWLQQARAAAGSTADRKLVLGQLGQVPRAEALELALDELSEPALVQEAAAAALAIAAKLAPQQPQLADQAARKVMAKVRSPELLQRAWALRLKPTAPGPCIRQWVVAGPYRQDGVVGAEAVFNLVFGPEQQFGAGASTPSQPTGVGSPPQPKVQWQPVPEADVVDLAALFPGQANCVAYLQTQIIAPADTAALLLLGSDDGVKAWLNGQLVHSHNVDRGLVLDQDAAWVQLRQGTNHLLLKISQGGGGWAAAARIVGPEGQPIPGLIFRRPSPGE